MSFFSGKKKTYVGTVTNRLIEDNRFISSVKSGTIKSIFAKSSATTDYIMEDLINGLGFTAKQFYKFGRDKYPYGLPKAVGVSEAGSGQIVQDYLRTSTGLPNLLVYRNFISIYNYWHAAFTFLDAKWEINARTGKLSGPSTQKDKTVFLADVTLFMNQATFDAIAEDSLVNRTFPQNAYPITTQIDNTAPNNSITVQAAYFWDTGTTTSSGGGEGGPLVITPVYDGEIIGFPDNLIKPGYNTTDQYFHTIHEHDTGSGIDYGFVNYLIGSGGSFAMDNVFNPAVNGAGSYFPWTYFRYNKIKGNEDLNDPGYKAAKRMLKKINMDYDEICDKIHENPDIADVEQAMMIWSVQADSQHPLDLRYLFEYFDNTFLDSGGMPYDLDHADLADPDIVAGLVNFGALLIQDARFKMNLSNAGMYKRTFAGDIGPVGTYASGELNLYFEYDVSQDSEGGTVVTTVQYPIPSFYYRKQVAPGWYEEILVMGLSMQYLIYNEYFTTADGDTDDSRTDILLVPLDMSVAQAFSLLDREELYSRSLYFVFNSRVTVKIAWYQSTFFQFFIIVVALVIALWDGGTSLTTYLAGLTALSMEALIYTLLMAGLEYLAYSMAFKLFIKVVGVKVAFLVAIIGMAVGYGAQLANKFGANLTQQLPYAGDLLKVSSGLAKAVKSEYEGDITGMQKEMAAMATDLKALGVQTKSIEDEMAENSTYAPFIPMSSETPEDFYNRTIHAGNIGMIGIDAVSNFVARSLALPEPQTFGEPV